jgi:hypothetical protein
MGAGLIQRDHLASITVSSGSGASAFATAGYLELKSLSFLDRRRTLPSDLIASAR